MLPLPWMHCKVSLLYIPFTCKNFNSVSLYPSCYLFVSDDLCCDTFSWNIFLHFCTKRVFYGFATGYTKTKNHVLFLMCVLLLLEKYMCVRACAHAYVSVHACLRVVGVGGAFRFVVDV